MKKLKPYKSKSLTAANRRVNQLLKQIFEINDLLERFYQERKMMAMLASETPQFFNPLDVLHAKMVRDGILNTLPK